MKIVIIGASKGIGKATVNEALAAGHEVTAFSRSIENSVINHPLLTKLAGNVLNQDDLNQAIKGNDVVICTLGLPTLAAIGPPFARPSYVLSAGTRNIIMAMKAQKVKRLICVTAISAGESKNQCTLTARLVFRLGLRWLFKEKDLQEELINGSSLDWIIVRPTALTNGRPKGAKRMDNNFRCGLLTQISRADVAKEMIAMTGDITTIRKTIVISYPPRLGDSVRWIMGYFGSN